MTLDLLAVIFGLLTLLAGLMAWRASRSISSDFNLEDLFLDARTRKASLSKIGQFAALCVSTWGFVYVTLHGTLTEWYYATYMTTWSLTNLGHKWLDQQKDKPRDLPAQ